MFLRYKSFFSLFVNSDQTNFLTNIHSGDSPSYPGSSGGVYGLILLTRKKYMTGETAMDST